MPGVISASDSKALAQQILARRWAERDKLTVRLMPKRLSLRPGSVIRIADEAAVWTVEKAAIDGFVIIAECRRAVGTVPAMAADGGRGQSAADVVAGPLSLALLDVPNVIGASSADPLLLVAASSAGPGWTGRPIEIQADPQSVATKTAPLKSVLGQALTVLPSAASELIDVQHSVDVELVDSEQWLISCDDAALASGQNLAVLGSELIQFGQAVPLAAGRFRLSRILRGRGGTEWAVTVHSAGEQFCLITPGSLQAISLPTWAIGADVTATGGGGVAPPINFRGESIRPPSPVSLRAERRVNGDLEVSWIRRSRSGFAWIDGVDAPLGETRELYQITIEASAASIEREASEPTLLLASADLAALGMGSAVIEARQIGDFAASRPAQLSINLS